MLPSKTYFTPQHKREARAADKLCKLLGPLTELPVKEVLEAGIYQRAMFVPAGVLIVGKIWTVPHVFQLLKGKMVIRNVHGSGTFEAPHTIVCPVDQRILYAVEDSIINVVVTTDCTTPEEVMEHCVVETFSQLNKKLRR